MLIDDVTISVSAGHGGAGIVEFNKQAMSLGPTGGNGGKGGSMYALGVSDLGALDHFRYKKIILQYEMRNKANKSHANTNMGT